MFAVLLVLVAALAEARCGRKYAIRAALATDRLWYAALNQHNWQRAVEYVWCKGMATLVEPIGPRASCLAVTNSFPMTLNFFNDLEFSPVIRDVRYHNNGTVSIHSADIIVINGTTVTAQDSYRWYDAKPSTCNYKLSKLYTVNWLCVDQGERGCGCLVPSN